MRNRGELMPLSSWGALLVTDWTPQHQAREKSHGWLTTYRLVLMFTAAYALRTRRSEVVLQHTHEEGAGPSLILTHLVSSVDMEL
uniref:Uncharacterized protein n=1 Tax=Cyclopterus lumpus TaxID=8103 RepID=A0A8C2XM79_CYCLU